MGFFRNVNEISSGRILTRQEPLGYNQIMQILAIEFPLELSLTYIDRRSEADSFVLEESLGDGATRQKLDQIARGMDPLEGEVLRGNYQRFERIFGMKEFGHYIDLGKNMAGLAFGRGPEISGASFYFEGEHLVLDAILRDR